jgi:hypothetical protein
MTTTTTIAPSATSARVVTDATDATIWAMFDIGTFLVEQAQSESVRTGFQIRPFLWNQFPFTEAAMAAFVTACEATGNATRFSYAIDRITDREERPTTPEEHREYINITTLQDLSWSLFKTVFVDTIIPHHKNFAEGRVDDEMWAVIKAFRALERERQ